MPRSRPLLAAVPIVLVGLSACGSSTLSRDELATKAEDALEQQIGVRPNISCPDDVEAKVGVQTRCTLTGGDDPTEYGVSITVTEVDGDNAKFDIQVDDQPSG